MDSRVKAPIDHLPPKPREPQSRMTLNKEIIKELIRESDKKWFSHHSGEYKYEAHLEFTADYVSRRYKKGQNLGTG